VRYPRGRTLRPVPRATQKPADGQSILWVPKTPIGLLPGFLGLHLDLVSQQVLPNAARRSFGKYRRSFWYIVPSRYAGSGFRHPQVHGVLLSLGSQRRSARNAGWV
jgi:hypothetical protein